MAARVLFAGAYRSAGEVEALLQQCVLARTYKRDKDGKFGSGSGGGGTPEQMHEEATIHATFDYHDQKTGLTAKVSGIQAGHSGQTYVSITVTDRDGKVVGEGLRSIRDPAMREVKHVNFGIDEGFQGQGFMARYNQQVEQSYRDHGIERIEVHAAGGNGAVGAYAWARAGYDFATQGAREGVARAATEHAQRAGVTPAAKAEIARVAGNPNSSPAEFAMIGHTSGATTWPGKDILLGYDAGWDGVKTL